MSWVFGETAGVLETEFLPALDEELDEVPQAPATTNNESARPTGRSRECMAPG